MRLPFHSWDTTLSIMTLKTRIIAHCHIVGATSYQLTGGNYRYDNHQILLAQHLLDEFPFNRPLRFYDMTNNVLSKNNKWIN